MPICKQCFQAFELRHLFHYWLPPALCIRCYQKLEWHHQLGRFLGFPMESLFDYGEHFQATIHQFKTLRDVVLGEVFLNQHRLYLRWKYHDYTLIPAPSHPLDTAQRGFLPLQEIWRDVSLPWLDAFEKRVPYRQAEQGTEGRLGIHSILTRKEGVNLPKKILLIDDVMTSGETMKAMIGLLATEERPLVKIFILARKKVEKNEITSANKNDKIRTWKQQIWHGLKNSLNSKKNN
jgi:predicted amidophosphoribosyltransferase